MKAKREDYPEHSAERLVLDCLPDQALDDATVRRVAEKIRRAAPRLLAKAKNP
jgi:hypothetical protein